MAQRKNEAAWVEARQRWQIKVQNDGERRTFVSSTPGKKGKAEAERKAEKWLTTGTKNENIRFCQLWADFLAETEKTTSPANYTKHEQMGRLWLLPQLQHKRVLAITEQHWQNCINAAYEKGLSKKSCSNIRGSITAFCRYARKNGIVIKNPEDLFIPKGAPVGKRTIMQPDEIKTLFTIDTIMQYGKPKKSFCIYAWRFILLTGLRRAELCNLKNEDIEENKILHIRGTKTEAADRYIALSPRMKSVLEEQKIMLKKAGVISPYIFPDEAGEYLKPKNIYKRWYVYRTQHGIKSSLHEMRHTMISVAKSDVPEELLKLIVGHTVKTDTFGIYGHTVNGDIERASALIDDVFSRILK